MFVCGGFVVTLYNLAHKLNGYTICMYLCTVRMYVCLYIVCVYVYVYPYVVLDMH